MKEAYFGFNKLIIKHQDREIIVYRLFKICENKCYIILLLMILN